MLAAAQPFTVAAAACERRVLAPAPQPAPARLAGTTTRTKPAGTGASGATAAPMTSEYNPLLLLPACSKCVYTANTSSPRLAGMLVSTASWVKRCQCGGMVWAATALVVRSSMPITVMASARVSKC